MSSLWNLYNLHEEVKDSPTAILNEQVEAFDMELNGVLYAQLLDSQSDVLSGRGYELISELNIIAPGLNNYVYKLLAVYSDITPLYPVLLVPLYNDDLSTNVASEIVCYDQFQFVSELSSILGAHKTNEIVRTLYTKSKMNLY